MKCDKLEKWQAWQFPSSARVYGASDVMEAIAELKAKLDKTIAERDGDRVCIDALKQKLENVQASMYADVVDANMENRKLKRALWLTRTLRARDIQRWWIAATCAPITERACSVWNNVERKCRAKAEEYR